MRKSLLLFLPAALAAGCQLFGPPPSRAIAELRATRGHAAAGLVQFEQIAGQVYLHAVVTGLEPGGEHGFHVHEVGDCRAPDASSAKGHFNPYGKPHAHYSTPERHAGDLPSLKADASGRAVLEKRLDVISVAAGPASIVGRAVIVHAQPDDYRTQPSGDAGARIACAVIRLAPKAY